MDFKQTIRITYYSTILRFLYLVDKHITTRIRRITDYFSKEQRQYRQMIRICKEEGLELRRGDIEL